MRCEEKKKGLRVVANEFMGGGTVVFIRCSKRCFSCTVVAAY